MFFSTGSEFVLVAGFLLVTLGIQALKRQSLTKWWLLLGSLLLLLTVVNVYTLSLQLLIGAAVFSIARFKAAKSRNWTGWTIFLLIVLFCLRNYNVFKGLDTGNALPPGFLIERLGISYLLFRHIQFLVDSHRQRIRHFSLLDYLNFLLFFPNFLAGPIDVYNHFQHWLNKDFGKLKKSLLLPGVGRIAIGLVKKYGIVPLFYAEATNYETLLPEFGPWVGILLSLLLYSFYIFLDFSGYSDIAIGTGYVLGIRTPENFRSPYLSLNIAEFWRRWHITFSNFLRNMIFVPLVKTLSKKLERWPRLSISIIGYLITFTICGIWHGSNTNFIYWGLWHGLGLSIYKAWDLSRMKTQWLERLNPTTSNAANAMAGVLTFSFVTIGWVFFNYSPGRLGKIVELLF